MSVGIEYAKVVAIEIIQVQEPIKTVTGHTIDIIILKVPIKRLSNTDKDPIPIPNHKLYVKNPTDDANSTADKPGKIALELEKVA